jgi:alpha,alpha-trehalase
MTEQNLFFIESLGTLYEDVQSSGIFADSKFFVDCIPKHAAAEIIRAYHNQKENSDFDLNEFVTANFILPQAIVSNYSSAQKKIATHLNDLWDELTRLPGQSGGTLIPLPNAYIVPGGRFREIYYWDSYFTMLGLQVSKRTDLIENMVNNFTYLINKVGFIPNGNRTYYLGRSQPPFFALMVKLLSEEKGDVVFTTYQTALEKEYQFWMSGQGELNEKQISCNRVILMPGKDILNRYWDNKDEPRPEAYAEDRHIVGLVDAIPAPIFRHIRAAAESGWDFSSRWFKDKLTMESIQTSNLIPVDLNCLLLNMEQTLLHIYQLQRDEINVQRFQKKVADRSNAIQHYCWNEARGCYFDFNFIDSKQEEHFNLSTVFPLFFKLATVAQAQKVAALIQEKFLFSGGLITTLYKTGQQWDAPNGWAPLQWMAYKGLKNYGYIELAQAIKNNWLHNCEKVFAETGKMMEKYNVMDSTIVAGGGEYPNQDGFGWTNGVYLKMKNEID